MFKRIVAAAAFAGLLSGLLLTAIQQIDITPLLREAEKREHAAVALVAPAQDHGAHRDRNETSAPDTRWQRMLATAVSNVVLATGLALLLGSLLELRGMTGWRTGLAWGIAGYVVFFVAPSLVLPPHLPGTNAGPLAERPLWWAATVLSSGVGAWLVAFAKRPANRILGLALLAAPQVVGLLQPTIQDGLDTSEMAQDFVRAAYIANAALWLTLGALVGLRLRIGD